MHQVIIVGGGLAGLALAHSLQARGIDWALLEARPRLGGRALTLRDGRGLAQDLGPTWYWPATQPSIARLVDDLGLASVAQPDDGRVQLLDDAARPARALAFDPSVGAPADGAGAQPGALHGGARRLVDGIGALIDALAARLPADRLHLGHALRAVQDVGDGLTLQVDRNGAGATAGATAEATAPHADPGAAPDASDADRTTWRARHLVLALPPRLVAERVRFSPGLPAELSDALSATPTWMAAAAKAVLSCAQAPWRAQGASGNAWVTHAQAVLAESWDAGTDDKPALAGFIAVPAAQRPPFRAAWPLLLESQAAMLWGDAARPEATQLQDWAEEPWTCSTLDRNEDGAAGHPVYGDARLQQPHWQGRLWLAGSETARHGGGYLEGALSSAGRVRQGLTQALAADLAAPRAVIRAVA